MRLCWLLLPDELPVWRPWGWFGLVWDGDGAKTCSGVFGRIAFLLTTLTRNQLSSIRLASVVWNSQPCLTLCLEGLWDCSEVFMTWRRQSGNLSDADYRFGRQCISVLARKSRWSLLKNSLKAFIISQGSRTDFFFEFSKNITNFKNLLIETSHRWNRGGKWLTYKFV